MFPKEAWIVFVELQLPILMIFLLPHLCSRMAAHLGGDACDLCNQVNGTGGIIIFPGASHSQIISLPSEVPPTGSGLLNELIMSVFPLNTEEVCIPMDVRISCQNSNTISNRHMFIRSYAATQQFNHFRIAKFVDVNSCEIESTFDRWDYSTCNLMAVPNPYTTRYNCDPRPH